MKAVRNLSLCLLIVKEYSKPGGTLSRVALRQLWKRSIAAAVIARKVGALRDPHLADEAFLAALLQDIGVLALMEAEPRKYREVLQGNLHHGPVLCAAEKTNYGIDHMEAGRILAEKWKLPYSYQKCLSMHHNDIDEIEGMTPDDLLDKLVRFSAEAACLTTSLGDPLEVVRLQDVAEKHFSMNDDQLANMLAETHMHAVELGAILDVPMDGMQKYAELLEQANQKLSEIGMSYEEALAEAHRERERAKDLAVALEEHNRRLERMAVRDVLTGIYNRRALMDNIVLEIARAKRHGRSMSLLMMDIDNFKKVNDTYGHQTGDEVLRHVTSTIQLVARDTDVFGRYGGEEFLIVLPETSASGVKLLQERVRTAVEGAPYIKDTVHIDVTISTGATSYSSDAGDVSPSMLIEAADKALYEAKNSGRNCSCYGAMSPAE